MGEEITELPILRRAAMIELIAPSGLRADSNEEDEDEREEDEDEREEGEEDEDEREGDEEDEDTVPLALSSEYGVERWFGREILDHSPGAVDLSRAEAGIPLLDAHDSGSVRSQIGVIERLELGADRKLRGVARFSRRPEARAILQDVRDGIIRAVSIGYRIREMVLERADDSGETYRATRWELLEGSLVPVPADPSVGAFRGEGAGLFPVTITRDTTGHKARSNAMTGNTVAANGAANVRVTGGEQERARSLAISELCNSLGVSDRAAGFIAGGKPVNEVATELAREANANLQVMTNPNPAGLSDREAGRYSLLRAIDAAASGNWTGAGFEREVSEAVERALPGGYRRRSATSFFMPANVRAAIGVGTPTTAGNLVFTEQGTFIDLLRHRTKVIELGATVISGLDGPVEFPKQTGAGSAAWLNEGGELTETNLTVGRVALTAKTVRGRQAVTKQLLRQSNSVGADQLIQRDLAAINAIAIDRAALHGGGSAEPTGLAGTSGLNVVPIGTHGGALTYAHLVDMEKMIGEDNADMGSMAFLTTPGVRAKFRQVAPLANTAALPAWTGGMVGELYGYPAHVSNNVRSNIVKGDSTDCHAVFFGSWSNLLIGEFGVMELEVDPYSRADFGEVIVRSFHMVGVAVRYAEAFAAILDARPQL
jgi:HK97 family phage major capsid protein/HK97 family phage prohead protease